MTLKLENPLIISSRLMPAVQIGDGCLSFDTEKLVFWLDIPAGEFLIDDFRPGAVRHATTEKFITYCLANLLGFLSAAAESYSYSMRTGMDSENRYLLNPVVTEWAYMNSEEIGYLECELEESR